MGEPRSGRYLFPVRAAGRRYLKRKKPTAGPILVREVAECDGSRQPNGAMPLWATCSDPVLRRGRALSLVAGSALGPWSSRAMGQLPVFGPPALAGPVHGISGFPCGSLMFWSLGSWQTRTKKAHKLASRQHWRSIGSTCGCQACRRCNRNLPASQKAKDCRP
jgi:hypothetical protein